MTKTMNTIPFEARRVAAAFGLKRWRRVTGAPDFRYSGWNDDFQVDWEIYHGDAKFERIKVCKILKSDSGFSGLGPPQELLRMVHTSPPLWVLHPRHDTADFLSRALFLLDFQDEAIWKKLGASVTMHEQIELRDAMPREFWLKSWKRELVEQ